MMKRALTLLPLILASCAPTIYTRPNTTQADLNLDRYECKVSARSNINPLDGPLTRGVEWALDFDECMKAHGYSVRN